jgi:uncharacterized phage protein (TIGR01671 family)
MKDNKDDKLYNKKRKIEFRGKCENTNKWEYGLVGITKNGNFLINNSKQHFIDENTLGQFTGLCDKNGKKIYEGDVLDDNDGKPTFVVVWQCGCFCFAGVAEYFDYLKYGYADYVETVAGDFIIDICSVLGNVYDNPELIGGSHESGSD